MDKTCHHCHKPATWTGYDNHPACDYHFYHGNKPEQPPTGGIINFINNQPPTKTLTKDGWDNLWASIPRRYRK